MLLSDAVSPGFGGRETLIIRMAKWCAENHVPCFWLGVTNPDNPQFETTMSNTGIQEIVMFPRENGKIMMDYCKKVMFKFEGVRHLTVICMGKFELVYASDILRQRYKDIEIDIFYYAIHFVNLSWIKDASPKAILAGKVSKPHTVIRKLADNGMLVSMDQLIIDHTKIVRPKVAPSLEACKIIRLPMQLTAGDFDKKQILQKLQNGNKRIITCARLEFPFKGYILGLIEDFAEIAKSYQDLTLSIIGDGSGRALLEEKINKQPENIRQRISWIPSMIYSDLKEYMKTGFAYVGMGTTVLDACNCAVPSFCVAPYSYSCKSNGFFCDNWDNLADYDFQKPIADFLKELLKMDLSQYIDCAYSCKEAVNKHYDINAIMQEWLSLRNDNHNRITTPVNTFLYRTCMRLAYIFNL